ncbi:ATP-binding protein [Buchananella felis]|uniref:uridine kinase family protein n=1 Tax=Buchananella felis TaxID=3231492 RepID=UPI003527CF1E
MPSLPLPPSADDSTDQFRLDDAAPYRSDQEPLFELPPGVAPQPRARVVLLAGPSGCGKTSMTRRLGLPVVNLDEFYKDDTAPGLPMLSGSLVDWDSPEAWHTDQALAALVELAFHGSCEMPVYSIPLNRRTGTTKMSLGDHRVFIAEGVFASHMVSHARKAGILADAICIKRPRWKNFWFRLLRDVAEGRKSLPVILRRGFRLLRLEPSFIRAWVADGCEPMDIPQAEARIRHHATHPAGG